MTYTIYITVGMAAIGWLIAIWKTVVANNYKKEAVIFENRLMIYNEYFEKIDGINERLMLDYQEFVGVKVNQIFSQILTDPGGSSLAIIELQEALSQMHNKAAKNINQSTQELQKLRFIASKKTLAILDEYKTLAESQINKIPEILKSIDMQNFTNIDVEKNQELKNISERLIKTRNDLEKQMRADLGLD
jgi:restriction endonuclease